MLNCFTQAAWEDYLFWQASDKKKLRRINELLRDNARSPFDGIGKPEALRFEFSGWWSRRIDAEHRLVYKVQDDSIITLSCKDHY